MIEYNEQLAQETERSYQMPEIVAQRRRTLAALKLQPGEAVLDAGCGMGLLAREMGEIVGSDGRIIGIDNSTPMLNLARKRCADLPHISFANQSVQQLDLPDASFDVVTATQLLLYLPDVPAALAEMARLLKPNGRIAIIETDWRSVLFNTADDALTRRLFADWETSLPSPHLPEKLPGLLKGVGLTAVHIEAIPLLNTRYHPDNYSGGMVTYMLRTQLEAGTLTQPQADAYLNDLKQRSEHGEYFFCVNRYLFLGAKGLGLENCEL